MELIFSRALRSPDLIKIQLKSSGEVRENFLISMILFKKSLISKSSRGFSLRKFRGTGMTLYQINLDLITQLDESSRQQASGDAREGGPSNNSE